MARSKRANDPPVVVFFLDENVLGRRIAGVLREAGAVIQELGSDISRGTPDSEMLPLVGEKGWFLVTRDLRIKSRPAEVEARKRANLGVFMLRGRNMTGAQIAEALVKALPRMTTAAQKQTKPFVCYINAKGQVRLVEGKGRQCTGSLGQQGCMSAAPRLP